MTSSYFNLRRYVALCLFVFASSICVKTLAAEPHTTLQASGARQSTIKDAVDSAIRPLMAKCSIPGVAVGVIAVGKPYLFNYGVASTETKNPVARDTLFEIGSISKTVTATLASFAQLSGNLSLQDKTSKHLPSFHAWILRRNRPLGWHLRESGAVA